MLTKKETEERLSHVYDLDEVWQPAYEEALETILIMADWLESIYEVIGALPADAHTWLGYDSETTEHFCPYEEVELND